MIRILIFLATLLVSLTTKTLQAQQRISVSIENVVSDEGNVKFGLYDSTNFMKKPIQSVVSEIENQKSVAVFRDVPAGEYAIICYHDKNDNGKMDFSPEGMPLEDYGVSNNKINPYGPPIYQDCKFVVENKEVSLEIRF